MDGQQRQDPDGAGQDQADPVDAELARTLAEPVTRDQPDSTPQAEPARRQPMIDWDGGTR